MSLNVSLDAAVLPTSWTQTGDTPYITLTLTNNESFGVVALLPSVRLNDWHFGGGQIVSLAGSRSVFLEIPAGRSSLITFPAPPIVAPVTPPSPGQSIQQLVITSSVDFSSAPEGANLLMVTKTASVVLTVGPA